MSPANVYRFFSSKGAWANISPRSNRNDPICFSPYLYQPGIWSSCSSTRSSTAAGLQRATTSSPPTTLPSCNSHLSGYGCALMSPHPSADGLDTRGRALHSIQQKTSRNGILSQQFQRVGRAIGDVLWSVLQRAAARPPLSFHPSLHRQSDRACVPGNNRRRKQNARSVTTAGA